ncbi:MAG TPA: tRNA guanosine(15) transglycosylase TgtA, partial [Candidatus Bathyarchaeota archaeon]|nr:tRNA guanosine(15) transglycosylase TgtA [Candidatus Bathyarchaeota archaeon]
MAFEQRDRDILGRTGRITVKGKTVETPVFLPVVNPLIDTIPPRRLEEEFRCQALITNSYIVWKHMDRENPPDIHALLDFHGVVMTDSGAYQILVYGGVEVSQREIIEWQKAINSDIAVILDIPTGWGVDREKVEATVEETLRRAREAVPLIRDSDALWVGPIQGGVYLDLVARSAREVGEMPYHIHALGSPTQVMERYNYPVLVDMAMTAKINAPRSRPLHLFGAGHPNILALSVAMGYDIFDSASYALFAKDDRYMTPRTTLQLGSLEHLPCTCPVCSKTDPQSLRELPKGERQRKLAEHNLH